MKESYRLFQKKLVTYCSPTLSHLNVASLFAIDKREIENYQECIRYFNRSLRTYRLSLMILKNKQNRLLIYLYHYNQLKYLLSKKEIKLFLHERHYPTNCLHATLGRLKCNLMSDSFPHEIGIFLGYPLYDVNCFINHKKCKYVGYWKVYGNLKNAKKQFERYECAKRTMCHKIDKGCMLTELLNFSL